MTEESKLPVEEVPAVEARVEAKLIDELQRMAYEPLLPVEKKLITWSLIIGVAALGLLWWISITFFPGSH